MKNIIKKIGVMISVVVLSFNTAYAKESVGLYIDGWEVATEPTFYETQGGEQASKYYMDVLPEVKEGRTYVPISIISKFLGAQVKWESPVVTIHYNESTLILKVGEKQATKNGEVMALDAPVYIEAGRTMVPLRFISEALGIGVEYKDGKVSMDYPMTQGQKYVLWSMQREYWMTIGSEVLENKCNLGISRCYVLLQDIMTQEVAAPSDFGRLCNIDGEDSYYLSEGIYFTGRAGEIIERYEIYTGTSYGMATGEYKLRDVTNNKWYVIKEETIGQLKELETIGDWISISNTIV